MSQPLMVIGDVHGCYSQLAKLLDSTYSNGRHIVFVGDLIDRGPDSSKVLGITAELAIAWPQGITLLRGNHEQGLLDFIETGDSDVFLRNGGLSTVASYYKSVPPNVLQAFRQEFPTAHLTLLRDSHTYLETDRLLISHMGYDPARPAARDLKAMVLQAHYELFHLAPLAPEWLTVCGHYAQRSGRPHVASALVCVDTGCGTLPGAPLTAFLLPERKIVQVDAEGNIQ